MLDNSKGGARDFRELCNYSYDCQAKGRECASWHTSTPNPRTNKTNQIHINRLISQYEFTFNPANSSSNSEDTLSEK